MFNATALVDIQARLKQLGITPDAAMKAIADSNVDTSKILPGFSTDDVAAVVQLVLGTTSYKQKIFTLIYVVLSFLTGLGVAIPTSITELFSPTAITETAPADRTTPLSNSEIDSLVAPATDQ